MSDDSRTKELLQNLLDGLYKQEARAAPVQQDSYLVAQDNQYLGWITDSSYDTNSILNPYGPYGSQYSSSSIFNPYSPYGSEYGRFSVNNPYCSTPPKLYIGGRFRGHVSVNRYVPDLIPTHAFLYTLRNDIQSLLAGSIIESEDEARRLRGESFVVAADGTFLGTLNPNQYDNESIFNQYGPYGNRYSPISIFNPYSQHGGLFSDMSPFNQYANNPPQVFLRGRFYGYLTVNPQKSPRLDPNNLISWARSNLTSYA